MRWQSGWPACTVRTRRRFLWLPTKRYVPGTARSFSETRWLEWGEWTEEWFAGFWIYKTWVAE